MGWSRETNEKVTVASAGSSYATDTPCSAPFRNLTIILSSDGLSYGAGDLEWEVIYHNAWDGVPFGSSSTPVGGIVQSSGTIVLPSEVIHMIYEDSSLHRSNKKVSQTSTYPGLQNTGGPAISLKLTNNTAADLDIYVTFLSEVVSEAQ